MNRNFIAVTGVLAVGALMSGIPASAQQTTQSGQNTGSPNSPAPSNETGEGRSQGGLITNQTVGTATGAAAATSTATNSRDAQSNRRNARNDRGTSSANNGSGMDTMSSVSAPLGNANPVLERAAEMLRTSRMRMADAPSGARQSYQAAVNALTRMLRTYGVSADGAISGRGVNVTASQAADDVRTLRSVAKNNRSGNMQQAASLYATGAKEFFTGQLREALYSSTATVVLRGDGRPSMRGNRNNTSRNAPAMNTPTGNASSAVQGGPGVVDPNATNAPEPNAPVMPGVAPGAVPQMNLTPGNTVNLNSGPAGTLTPNIPTMPTTPRAPGQPIGGFQNLGFPLINQYFPGFTYPQTYIYNGFGFY